MKRSHLSLLCPIEVLPKGALYGLCMQTFDKEIGFLFNQYIIPVPGRKFMPFSAIHRKATLIFFPVVMPFRYTILLLLFLGLPEDGGLFTK